jgi:hypothetical protein
MVFCRIAIRFGRGHMLGMRGIGRRDGGLEDLGRDDEKEPRYLFLEIVIEGFLKNFIRWDTVRMKWEG